MNIVPAKQEDWQVTIKIASDQVFEKWNKHLFDTARNYNRVPSDAKPENYSEAQLQKLFTPGEINMAHDIAVTNVLDDIAEAAGRGLLVKMWQMYQTAQWASFRPSEQEDWRFTDFVTAGLSGKTADYRQKLALVCERVFMWLKVNKIADEDGVVVDALYMIRNFGPYMLIQISQSIFSKKPPFDIAQKALLAIINSDQPGEEVIKQANAIDRWRDGVEGNFFYIRELPEDGGARFYITLTNPKLVRKLSKQLEKMGEMRMWAGDQDVDFNLDTDFSEAPTIEDDDES